MRILLTGASGFIGAHVARHLAQEGLEVVGFSRSQPPEWAHLHRWFPGDVTDADAVASAIRGATAVIHCAALYSYSRAEAETMQRTNVDGTWNVCQAAVREGVQRLVLTSTSATCGPVPGRPATERDRAPAWELTVPYKRTKLEAEKIALAMVKQGLDVVCVNPTTTVGAGDAKPTPSGKMIRDLVDGRIGAFVRTGGLNVVGVRDVAVGHLLALSRGRAGERYILGGEDLGMDEAFAYAAVAAGRRAPRLAVPWALPYALARVDQAVHGVIGGEPRLLILDEVKLARHPLFFSSDKAATELGYAPGPAAAALAEAARWFATRARQAPPHATWRTRLAASGRASIRSGGGAA